MGQRIDVRLTLAALNAAIALRQPPAGCLRHSDSQFARASVAGRSDRGSQYAALKCRRRLAAAKLVDSMGRRGNPYDNAMMESLMKTVKVEGVYPLAFGIEDDVAAHFPRFVEAYNERRLHSSLGYLSPIRAMRKFGLWASGGGLFLGVLNGLAVAAPDALDQLAEAVGAVEPAPVVLGRRDELEDPCGAAAE